MLKMSLFGFMEVFLCIFKIAHYSQHVNYGSTLDFTMCKHSWFCLWNNFLCLLKCFYLAYVNWSSIRLLCHLFQNACFTLQVHCLLFLLHTVKQSHVCLFLNYTVLEENFSNIGSVMFWLLKVSSAACCITFIHNSSLFWRLQITSALTS